MLKKVKGSCEDPLFKSYEPIPYYPDLENAFNKGVISATHKKIENLSQSGASPADLSTAKKLNDELIGRGNFRALGRKIQGLEREKYGYKSPIGPKDGEYQVNRIITDGVNNNQVWAFELRINRWAHSIFFTDAYKLADDFAAKGYDAGHFAKLDLLSDVSQSLSLILIDKQKSIRCRDIIENGLETNEPWAILAKVEGLLLGKWHFDPNQEAGLDFAQKEYRYAYHYLKAVGNWFGIMGFEKDIEEAKRIMRANSIVF